MAKTKLFSAGSSLAAVMTVSLFGAAAPAALAQSSEEEIVVTGSHIRGTPEDAALPVDVIGREELQQLGTPTVTELVRNLPVAQGLIGETNQFDTRGGQASVGATTINLRGLGSPRTLVLINGRRHVADSIIGVDVNAIPSNAIGRIEVLKDGAAATYGSDAIGGVVNFITRRDFEGLELSASHQFIDGSDGDSEIGAVWGIGDDNFNLMAALQFSHRGKLQAIDRDWAVRPFLENVQGGWSSIGHPGTFLGANPVTGAPTTGFNPDPQCNLLGGFSAGGFCRFQYTFFDNLIEETDLLRGMATLDLDIGSSTLHVEGLFANQDIDDWNTSPAYPPQVLLGNFVPATHPGLIDMFAQNPAFAAAVGNGPVIFWGRYAGVDGIFGEPETGIRENDARRLAASLTGPISDALDYDIGVSYSDHAYHLTVDDMYVQRFGFALRGLGGPGCDPSTGTPGVGPCMYYNPFSNAIQTSAVTGGTNPQFNPAVANSPVLLEWLTDTLEATTTYKLLVFDAAISGETGWTLGGGPVGFALGIQARNEDYKVEVNDITNLNLNPCPWTDPTATTTVPPLTTSLVCPSPTGPFAFLSGTFPEAFDRTVYAGFFELVFPFTDAFNVQFSGRYEDYGGEVGSTFDPKLAARWQLTDNIALRGSASTTFRGPPQGFLSGRGTALAFVGPTNAFKAIDTLGNPNLEPETALATNFGVLVNAGGFTGSIDYWRFDFQKPFQVENFSQIVTAYVSGLCADGQANAATPTCLALRSHIFPTGTLASGIQRIEVQWINGSDITTSGIDFLAQYDWEWGATELTLGVQGTYTLEYESDDFVDSNGVVIAPGDDFVGYLNEGTPFQPLIQLRGNVFASLTNGPHNFRYVARYVDSYQDRDSGVVSPASLRNIDAQWTHDIHYNLDLFDGNTRLALSVINVADEDPPQTSTDLNYDPYTHNPFGRMFKVGLTQRF